MAAARETAATLWRLAVLLFCVGLVCVAGGALVAAAYFALRWLQPNLAIKDAITIAVMAMILPTAAIAWFGIVFSVELEQRRRGRD